MKVIDPLKLCELDGECASFKCTLATDASQWTMILRLIKRSRGIEVENLVDWHENHTLAKAEFNCNILTRKALCDTSAGYIERETHRNTSWQQARFETCHHKWCSIAEAFGGIALINNSKYGVGFHNSSMSLSLLRATERPDVISDLGTHHFCYMIMPHKGDAINAGINNIALQYNNPLIRCEAKWELPTFEPLLLQAAKRSEDGRMKVLRLSEQYGNRGFILLEKPVKILNMLEEEIKETDVLEYKPFEIITIGVED